MSGQNTKVNERSEGGVQSSDDKVFYIPRKVVKDNQSIQANWRDDVAEEAEEENEAIGLELFENEEKYESPAKPANEEEFEEKEKLSGIIQRAKAQKIGINVLGFYRKVA